MCFDQGHSVTREERGKAKRKGKYVRTGTMEGTAAQAKLNGERMYSVPNTFVEKRDQKLLNVKFTSQNVEKIGFI